MPVNYTAIIFVPPLYGSYLQNPFSFLRNRAEIGGDIVFALDRGDDANQARPERSRTALDTDSR